MFSLSRVIGVQLFKHNFYVRKHIGELSMLAHTMKITQGFTNSRELIDSVSQLLLLMSESLGKSLKFKSQAFIVIDVGFKFILAESKWRRLGCNVKLWVNGTKVWNCWWFLASINLHLKMFLNVLRGWRCEKLVNICWGSKLIWIH